MEFFTRFFGNYYAWFLLFMVSWVVTMSGMGLSDCYPNNYPQLVNAVPSLYLSTIAIGVVALASTGVDRITRRCQ